MSKSYRLVVFDWEGTLGDTLGQIIHGVAAQAELLGFGALDDALARQSVELGLEKAIQRAFPQLNHMQQEQLLLGVHQSLASRSAQVFLIPGAREMVARLKEAGIDLAIASNKGQQSLQRVLHVTGFDKLFTVTRTASQSEAKPSPQMLLEIMEVFGVSSDETLMVGDSVNDIEMANNCKVDAIGVDFYHQQENALRLAGALEVFDDYQQLANYLHLP
ncbi:MAG: HAD-IIIA family hydrolase [Tatlockia sp.]|jgi:phosphoglycolate phosphatase